MHKHGKVRQHTATVHTLISFQKNNKWVEVLARVLMQHMSCNLLQVDAILQKHKSTNQSSYQKGCDHIHSSSKRAHQNQQLLCDLLTLSGSRKSWVFAGWNLNTEGGLFSIVHVNTLNKDKYTELSLTSELYPFSYSPIHSLTHSLTRSFTRSLSLSLIHAVSHSDSNN